jgi:hypothetical protein
LLIEHACLRVLAVVELVVTWEACSSCREVCSGRNLGDGALGDVLVVRRAVACVAGWTGSANEPIAVRTRPKTLLQVSRTGEGDLKRADDAHGHRAERATDDGSGHDIFASVRSYGAATPYQLSVVNLQPILNSARSSVVHDDDPESPVPEVGCGRLTL